MTGTVFDVAIVGFGPVGAVLAILLGQRGQRVVVLERHVDPYPLPRAVHYDHEIARILQACGVAEACAKIVEPVDVYEFRNAAGEPLMRLGRTGNGPSGWPQSTMFSQPDLEAVLYARVDELPSVEVRRGMHVTSVEDQGDHVVLHADRLERDVTPTRRSTLRLAGAAEGVQARYAVGCDGANSTVRSVLDMPMIDRAFFYDWLIVDVVFDEPRVFDPINMQVCDPARPTTVVSGGPGRRRWEFMALPNEAIDDLNGEATAWRLLEPWGARPDNARLERHAVYRFQARWTGEWRRGRVLLAGDAAHQTPPFAGQGMCAGIRDAANLAWKLDLVLAGAAPEPLLDVYGAERAPNMEAVIDLAIEMGKMICVTDPDEAAARDEAFRAVYDGSISEIPPFPGLTEGVILAGTPKAGELFVQGIVEHNGLRARFDDVVGAGWRLVSSRDVRMDPDLADWFAGIGGRVVAVGADTGVVDVEGTYAEWFARHDVVAALQRPDFYVFGTAASHDDVDRLLAMLRRELQHP